MNSPSVCVGTDHPALKFLNKFRDEIATKWHDIGVELLDIGDESALNGIKANHPGDINKCAAEMLQLWLDRKTDASWNRLIEVLRKPNIKLNVLAKKIEDLLSKGMIAYLLHILGFTFMQ